MPDHPPVPGRSSVSRRAIAHLVRGAALGSYGVAGLEGDDPLGRVLRAVRLAAEPIEVRLGERLEVDLRLTIAYGLPVAEVARQVESAVRYTLRRALEREADRVTIHVGGLRYDPGAEPPATTPQVRPEAADVGPQEPGPDGSRGAGGPASDAA